MNIELLSKNKKIDIQTINEIEKKIYIYKNILRFFVSLNQTQ